MIKKDLKAQQKRATAATGASSPAHCTGLGRAWQDNLHAVLLPRL